MGFLEIRNIRTEVTNAFKNSINGLVTWSTLLKIADRIFDDYSPKETFILRDEDSGNRFKTYFQLKTPASPWLIKDHSLFIDVQWREQAITKLAEASEDDYLQLFLTLIEGFDYRLARELLDLDHRSREKIHAQARNSHLTPLPQRGFDSPLWTDPTSDPEENENQTIQYQLFKWWPTQLNPTYRPKTMTRYLAMHLYAYASTRNPMTIMSQTQYLAEPAGNEDGFQIRLVSIPTDFDKPNVEDKANGETAYLALRLCHIQNEKRFYCEPLIAHPWFAGDQVAGDSLTLTAFPELSMTSQTEDHLKSLSKTRDSLFIAGSRHFEDDNGDFINRALFLNPLQNKNRPCPEHIKRAPIQMEQNEYFELIPQSTHHQYCTQDFPIFEVSWQSNQRRPSSPPLICLESPVGRISFLICKDFLDPGPCSPCLLKARVDHLIVISLNPGYNKKFESEAEKMASQNHCAVYVVNAPILSATKPTVRFTVALPTRNGLLRYPATPGADNGCLETYSHQVPGLTLETGPNHQVLSLTIQPARLVNHLAQKIKKT